jgi:hypothetical protein
MPAKFSLGQVVMTRGVGISIPPEEVLHALSRHVSGDWGEVCEEDARENEYSLKKGFRLLSVYRTTSGTSFWILTEADRSQTTVLLPNEY